MIKCYKFKFIQKEDEKEALQLHWQQEKGDKAAAMEAEMKRMRMESELHLNIERI